MNDRCHCGANTNGSDHCAACYCEQYETTCDNRNTAEGEAEA